jgi:hypothetical protein
MPLVKIKDCGQGVNRDLLPSELDPGMFSDCKNARSRNGFAEKRKGVTAAYTTPTVAPYFLALYTTTTDRFAVQAGIGKVFVDDGTTRTEITRYTDGAAIASITRAGTTATLTTSTNHGLITGNTVTVFGAVPTGYNGTYSITVTAATTFTYTMAADPGSSATTVGQYSYNVQADFTGTIDDKWTGGAFNGVLILNNPVDGMYYWNGDTSTRLRRMTGWTADMKADAILFFKNFILALGPTVSGTKQPQVLLWGSSAEAGAIPTSWTATATNDAGDTPQAAETGGHMVDGEVYGDTAFVYDQDSRFGVRYIGGNEVFQVYRVPDSDGLLARHCIKNTPKGQVLLSNGDVRIHNGGPSESIADGRVREWLGNSMDSDYAARSFLAVNPKKNEVWVCFPTTGNTSCDRALVWNWQSDTWGDFSISSMTCSATGLVASTIGSRIIDDDTDVIDSDVSAIDENDYSPNQARLVLGFTTPLIGLAETGSTDFGAAVEFMLEKRGISFDDSDAIKVLASSRPQFKGLAGAEVSIYHGSSMTADGEPTYTSAVTFTQGDNWANAFARAGRYLAWKCVSTDYPLLSLRSIDLDVKGGGRF